MLKTAFSTLGCPDWSWYELLDNGKRFGYDGVEIRLLNRETDLLKVPAFLPSERSTRRKELSETGFRVCGLASSVRFHDADFVERQRQVETGRQYLDLAKELDADFIRVFGDIVPAGIDRPTLVNQVAEGLNQLGEYAASLKLEVLIETHGDFSNSLLMQDTMNSVDSSVVGVLWDTHHPWRYYNEPLDETFHRLKRWVRHTHWKDSISRPRHNTVEQAEQAASEAHALMGGHRHADYVLFRGGEFPARECMRLLKQSGYDVWYSLEWEKMWHPEIEDSEIALPLFPGKIRELWECC